MPQSPSPVEVDPSQPPCTAARQSPWGCRWSYVAGTIRRASTAGAPGVLWTCCHPRDRCAKPVFTRDECQRCPRWVPRAPAVGPSFTVETEECPHGLIRHRQYRRGEPIINEGGRPDWLWTILSGTAKTFTMSSSGVPIGVDIVRPGTPLAVESVIDDIPFAVSAVALEDTLCVVVSRRPVVALLDKRPDLVRELLREVNERLVTVIDRVAQLTGARVEARLAHLFLALAGQLGERQNGGVTIATPLLRQDLADLTGTTFETCSRIMSRWAQQGIVRSERGVFVIGNRERLETLGSGEPPNGQARRDFWYSEP